MRSRPKVWLTAAALLIVLLGGALRFWSLPRPPAGPYYDEAANGILAADIAYHGYRPLFITAYTGKEVLFFYLAALAIRLLGSNLLALRFTSALVGTLTIPATLWCVYELFAGDDQREGSASADRERGLARIVAGGWSGLEHPAGMVALLVAALLATSFWHLALSRVGLRAVTQPLLQALCLAALWRGLRTGRWWALVSGGIFCGLAGYTYLAARLFPIPLALALLTLLASDRERWRQRLVQVATFVGAAVVVFAPLGWFFWRNPDRFAVRIQQVAAEGARLTLLQAFSRALGMFFVRGDPLPRLNLAAKPIFGPLLGGAFLVGLLLVAVHFYTRRQPLARARAMLLLSWIPLMILPTALTLADIVPHYLRAAGLLPLIFVFPALALVWLLGWLATWRPGWAAGLGWVALALVLALTAPVTIDDYFTRLAERSDHYEISDGDLADMAAWLNQADLSQTTVYVASVHFRHPTLAFLARDYPMFKWLTGGRTLAVPQQGSALLLAPRSVDYSWAEPYLSAAVPLAVPAAPDGKPAFHAYRLSPDALPDPSRTMRIDFGHIVQLEGYDVLEASCDAVDVVLHWRTLNPASRGDFQEFAHLVDAWRLRWAEALPFQYPSDQWTAGERFLDRLRIELPAGTPPGNYTLQVGLYSAAAQEHLPVVTPNGTFGGIVARIPVALSSRSAAGRVPLSGFRRPAGDELAPGLRLLGYNLDTVSPRTRDPLFLTLFWQAEARLDQRYIRLWLGDRLLYQDAPVHGSYPTTLWREGEGVVDRYSVRVPLDMPAGEWPLTVEVIGSEGDFRLVTLDRVTVSAPARSFAIPAMQHTLGHRLGGSVELVGFDATGLDGESVELVLYWRALREMEEDYTVFVHLLAADGSLVGQSDSEPRGGTYPTSLWAAEEVVIDQYEIPVPGTQGQTLYLQVGLYDPLTGIQLGESAKFPLPVTR